MKIMIKKKFVPNIYQKTLFKYFFTKTTGSPWSVFDNWHLKEQYKRSANRIELSQQLSKYIFYAGLINLIFAPVIFLFAAIFCVFSYGDVS